MPMIITVSRQLGAGGTQIASRVANLLQLRLIDRQILDRVAEEAGVTPEVVEALDESPAAVKSRPRPVAGETTTSTYGRLIEQAVLDYAGRGEALIVGRGAHLILAGRAGLLRVKVIAPTDVRVRSLMQRLSLSRTAAERAISESDRSRAQFIKMAYHVDWMDPGLYDLVVNTRHISYDAAAEAIATIARAIRQQSNGASA